MAATLYPQDPLPVWSAAGSGAGAARAAREAWAGRFPPRYAVDFWRQAFDRRLLGALPAATAILDAGAGAWPVVPPGAAPAGARYVGLDVSAEELRKAPAGAYDEIVVADVTDPPGDLAGRFDLVLSWYVLEHVGDLAAALGAMHGFLRPGGRLLAQFTGQLGVVGLLNRATPDRAAQALLRRTMGRRPETVFPAVYDRGRWGAVSAILAEQGWAEHEVVPLFTAGLYARFSRPLFAAYLAFEEVAWRRGWRNLAPYYLVDARR